MVADLLKYKTAMEYHMSIKVNFLDSHLDLFSGNLGTLNFKQGERFHQDIPTVEVRHEGKWSPNMPADYYRTLNRDDTQAKYSRNSSTVTFWIMYVLSVM
jgi:hypothetical protein